jgi:flagellar hook protein FlgE
MALNSVHSIALSGMQSAMQRLGSASHNIANWGTEGYRRELASAATQTGGGVTTSLQSAAAPGDSLAEDMVAQRVALYDFKSNMQVFKTQQDMLGTLLDLQA